MKISNETLTLLKNFAGINTNILFRQGNVLAIVSPGKNILSRAVIAESFPREFAIYDLNSLLALLTIADDQEVEFNESNMNVVLQGGDAFEYFYSDPGVVTAAPDKELEIDPMWDFILTSEQLSMIHRAASITDASVLNIVSDGNSVTLRVADPSRANANSYQRVIATGETYPSFDVRLRIENLKVLSDNYTVSLGRKKA
jgi:hypothetical protein